VTVLALTVMEAADSLNVLRPQLPLQPETPVISDVNALSLYILPFL